MDSPRDESLFTKRPQAHGGEVTTVCTPLVIPLVDDIFYKLARKGSDILPDPASYNCCYYDVSSLRFRGANNSNLITEFSSHLFDEMAKFNNIRNVLPEISQLAHIRDSWILEKRIRDETLYGTIEH